MTKQNQKQGWRHESDRVTLKSHKQSLPRLIRGESKAVSANHLNTILYSYLNVV